MCPDKQNVWTDGWNGWMDGRMDDAKLYPSASSGVNKKAVGIKRCMKISHLAIFNAVDKI